MKNLIWLGVLVVLIGGAIVWVNKSIENDKGEMVGFAVGPVEYGEHKLHIIASMGMVRNDPMRPGTNMKNEEEWINRKFFLHEGTMTGPLVRLMKAGMSPYITDQQSGNPEFFIEGRLKPKMHYVLDFKPFANAGDVYRHEFTTKDDGVAFARETLKLVK